MKACPVCATEVPDYQFEHPNGARIRCSVCGTYRITERAQQILGETRLYSENYTVVPRRRLSAALRQQTELGHEPLLEDHELMELMFDPAADLPEVIDRILRHIARKEPSGHRFVALTGNRDYGVAGAEGPEVFDHALGEAIKLGFIEREAPDEAAYRLTMLGWKHLRELPNMERTTLLKVADRAMCVLYDQEVHGRYSGPDLVDALELDEAQVARALRYAEKQGWITAKHVFGAQLPVDVSLTPAGMRYAESLLNARPSEAVTPNVVYNVSGPNARINISSHDASVNVVDLDANTLFARIEQAVSEGVADVTLREEVLESVRHLQAAPDASSRAERLGELLQVAANVITVIQPFLPALTQIVA